jgi:hypothetical protein
MSPERKGNGEPSRLSEDELRRIADEGLGRARSFLKKAYTEKLPTGGKRTEQARTIRTINSLFPQLEADVFQEIKEQQARIEEELQKEAKERRTGKTRRLPGSKE